MSPPHGRRKGTFPVKILIIGGYGTFGRRIAGQLKGETGLEITIAGRSFEKATELCNHLNGGLAHYLPLKLDRNEIALTFKPDLIIDASGPFQIYKDQPVIDYALAHKIHYADLSDDGAFVSSVRARQDDAHQAGVMLVSGLSTCSVLSAIGLRLIEERIGPVQDVTIGIGPSPKADLGRNVVAAVANYAGQTRVSVLRNGKAELAAGLTEVRRETICVPGQLPLKQLPFALADAPDAHSLPTEFQALQNIWTGAGTQPVFLHRCLIGLARLRHSLGKGSLAPFSDLFHRGKGFFRRGDHRGGMFVLGKNEKARASWHLIAEGDDGPYIPTLPAIALIRKLSAGTSITPGAYSGEALIDLQDLKPEFARFKITYGLQYDSAGLATYVKVMGDSYDKLHASIQDLHRTGNGRHFKGHCDIERGRNPLAHMIAFVFGFPKSGSDIPVEIKITPDEKGELWERRFNGKPMTSHHSMGRGRWSRHVTERFGPISIHMAILNEKGNMRIQTRGWSFLGLPLPKMLCPGGDVYESEDNGRFKFYVDLQAPLIGRMCRYIGYFEPVDKVGSKSE